MGIIQPARPICPGFRRAKMRPVGGSCCEVTATFTFVSDNAGSFTRDSFSGEWVDGLAPPPAYVAVFSEDVNPGSIIEGETLIITAEEGDSHGPWTISVDGPEVTVTPAITWEAQNNTVTRFRWTLGLRSMLDKPLAAERIAEMQTVYDD